MGEVFVPIVLTNTEAVACAAACGVVVTSAPDRLTPEHPLFSGMLKIERARKQALIEQGEQGAY